MKHHSFTMKTALLATLIVSGHALAQGLPDEVNHPQYLKVYQNLDQILKSKTADYDKLVAERSAISARIAELEKEAVRLPQRNSDLRAAIEGKKAEISRLDLEAAANEKTLAVTIQEIDRLNELLVQLKNDVNNESQSLNNLQNRRVQVNEAFQRANVRLQKELQDERESTNILAKLTNELNQSSQKRAEDIREQQDLNRDLPAIKRDVVINRNKLNSAIVALGPKKAQLAEAQAKAPAVKAKLSQEEAALRAVEQDLSPKKIRLGQLRADLNRLMPEVARLTSENQALTLKISQNNDKINASGIPALMAKRDALEAELVTINKEVASVAEQLVTLQEAIKPEMGRVNELRARMRSLERTNAGSPELASLKKELDDLEAVVLPKRSEIARVTKQHELLSFKLPLKNNELSKVKGSIAQGEAASVAYVNENAASAAKIAANQQVIIEKTAANAGLMSEINELDGAVKVLEASKEASSKVVTQIRNEDSTLTNQQNGLTREISQLENEMNQLQKIIADQDKAMAEYPQRIQRLDLHIRQMNESINSVGPQIQREQMLLARIQPSRAAAQQEAARIQADFDGVNNDVAQSQRQIADLQRRSQDEARNLENTKRNNQDALRKYETLKVLKASAEKAIIDSNQEISQGNQSISANGQRILDTKSDLAASQAKVSASEKIMNEAQEKTNDASSQYQNRLSLYQRYLSEAKNLGSDGAKIGTADGVRAGSLEAKAKAGKLATDNATAEAKWEAMRRAYIRGEISGHESGFEVGVSSLPDANQGEADGKVAGAKRAKDQANMVLKPEFYIQELMRRLNEDVVITKSSKAVSIQEALKMIAMTKVAAPESDIPELSREEIQASERVLSSLDALIGQSEIEAAQVVKLRSNLADARQVYATPGAGENAQKATCTTVFKNVKDFIDACKDSYGSNYQGLYATAHKETFIKEYGKVFSDTIIKTFESELSRLYPGFYKEASAVGKEAGISAGKKEIYRQSFSRAELASYSQNMVIEEERVSEEANAMVETHLSQNAALILKGSPKLVGDAAPGLQVDLSMVIKNIGGKASLGNSLVKIKEVSTNITVGAKETSLAPVKEKTLTELSVMKIRINDNANPGSKIVIAGEIIHPGNDYRASRSESFRLEAVVSINPDVDSSADFDNTPKTAGFLGGTKSHEIDIKLRPKYEGVDVGYEVSIEEVGSSYATFESNKTITERLRRGADKTVSFGYKLAKSAKGKTVNFKVTISNDQKAVKTLDLQIKPQ